jgi:hypothetical protein
MRTLDRVKQRHHEPVRSTPACELTSRRWHEPKQEEREATRERRKQAHVTSLTGWGYTVEFPFLVRKQNCSVEA